MKKNSSILFVVFSFFCLQIFAQQLPFYTQYRNNEYMMNPGITGTKRLLDLRMNYRMQWVGFEGGPRTTSVALHSRFLKGKMGAGFYYMQDKIGPSKQTNLGLSYAYHLRFPDCELSAGLSGNFTKYSLIGDQLNIHHTQDPSINQTYTDFTWVTDAGAGVYLYNDRFHVGASLLHGLQSNVEFYKADTTKKGQVTYAPHVYFTLGYNFSQNPNFVFESNVYTNYVAGAPFMLDYTMRIHYREQVFGGVSLRLRDAVALHLGFTIQQDFQVSYSYDIQIGKLKSTNKGTHEIMLVCSSNIFTYKHGRTKDDKFLHQRYGYLF